MDINLPDISGINALEILRRDVETRKIPTIAVSANAMLHDIAISEQAGFDAYITKPFEIADVRATIAQTLGARHATTESDAVPRLPIVEHAKNYHP